MSFSRGLIMHIITAHISTQTSYVNVSNNPFEEFKKYMYMNALHQGLKKQNVSKTKNTHEMFISKNDEHKKYQPKICLNTCNMI